VFGEPAPVADAFAAIEAFEPIVAAGLERGLRLHAYTRHMLGHHAIDLAEPRLGGGDVGDPAIDRDRQIRMRPLQPGSCMPARLGSKVSRRARTGTYRRSITAASPG
jgi:hypothetical protein